MGGHKPLHGQDSFLPLEPGPASLKKLSHRDDPATSKDAIGRLTATGARASHAARIYRAVRDHPGLTAMELTVPTGLMEYQVRRRLSDLKNLGVVRYGAERACTITKDSVMVTWLIAEPGGSNC